MVDDLNKTQKTNSGWLKAPEQWLHIPGNALKSRSWNTSLLDEPTYPNVRDNYIIQSTYFQYMSNISAIEYVPATTGKLFIDVSIQSKFTVKKLCVVGAKSSMP